MCHNWVVINCERYDMPTEGEKEPILDLEPGDFRIRPKLGSREDIRVQSINARALEIAQKGAESVDSKGIVTDEAVASLLGEKDSEKISEMEMKLSSESDEAEIEKIQAQINGIKTKSFRELSNNGGGHEVAAEKAAEALADYNLDARTKNNPGRDPLRERFFDSVIGNTRRIFGYKEK